MKCFKVLEHVTSKCDPNARREPLTDSSAAFIATGCEFDLLRLRKFTRESGGHWDNAGDEGLGYVRCQWPTEGVFIVDEALCFMGTRTTGACREFANVPKFLNLYADMVSRARPQTPFARFMGYAEDLSWPFEIAKRAMEMLFELDRFRATVYFQKTEAVLLAICLGYNIKSNDLEELPTIAVRIRATTSSRFADELRALADACEHVIQNQVEIKKQIDDQIDE